MTSHQVRKISLLTEPNINTAFPFTEYPFINKYKEYPVKHAKVIRKDFEPIENYFGLVKCSILPPRKLLLPLLPTTVNGKLYFALCRTCAAQKCQGVCKHTDDERLLHGTWCTPELHKAVILGYRVVQIEEVWHYEHRQKGLFAEYINAFLKLKTEASGWPDDVTTDAAKDAFVRDFYQHEGVLLEKEKMVKNAGMRGLAKLCLNSLWGRLGMRENKGKTEYVTEPERFNELMLSGMYQVNSFDLFTEDVMAVQYKFDDDFAEINPSTNVVIAAFTTSWARLHLYQYMEKLDHQLLYCDTDSVIFKWKPGQYLPPTGNYLGDLTSELQPDEWVEEFCSLGAKCYGYRTNKGSFCVKIKGHSINGLTKDSLNLDNMVRLLSSDSVENIKYCNVLKRSKKDLSISQIDMSKQWRVTFDKRVVTDEQFNTLPYGY